MPTKRLTTKRVLVTQFHIEGADRSAENNPVARAIRDRVGRGRVRTWEGYFAIDDEFYKLDSAVCERERKYSLTGVMEPFEFKISNTQVEVKPQEGVK